MDTKSSCVPNLLHYSILAIKMCTPETLCLLCELQAKIMLNAKILLGTFRKIA